MDVNEAGIGPESLKGYFNPRRISPNSPFSSREELLPKDIHNLWTMGSCCYTGTGMIQYAIIVIDG